jgi:hypothetical protein
MFLFGVHSFRINGITAGAECGGRYPACDNEFERVVFDLRPDAD